ncbi:cell division protein ZapA [Niallia endozanthoxylica]|uniref:Cell division protein ZapA n=1 Tax=Niallia endozanthoxylica TaxID=2036016 RepID=A0A5J5HQB7_9BACI|nr:cell division protein ZapA [Niallia endozanthoxylica]KAA9023192.1 cell division protein ZapA [Niallia endozanthoxylica]
MSQTKKNRITVDIYGVQYVVIGTESPRHIRRVASVVDEKMREINSMNPSLGTNKLAVLTAMNIVNDYLQLKEKVAHLEEELKRVKD